MYRSTGETMERLKSVNLKLKFHTTYNTHPIVIKYKGLAIENDIDIFLEKTDQIDFIEFSGFDHKDKSQQVTCNIFYNKELLDVHALCSFEMKNNKYVNNKKLFRYNQIHFNGELKLKFFKEWIECNLLSGACINHNKSDYINWSRTYEEKLIDRNRIKPLKNYDIICVGASMVHGTDQLDKSKAWPGQLQNILNLNVGNFGVEGNDHFGVMQNIEYIIKNFNVKKIIALLPAVPASFILPKRIKFLKKYVFLLCSVNIEKEPLLFNSEKKAWHQKNILKETFIKTFLSKKLEKIEKMCTDKNINLSLIYHSNVDRDNFNYNSERFEKFVFPEYTHKQSLKNNHPDETVHLEFAKQVIRKL